MQERTYPMTRQGVRNLDPAATFPAPAHHHSAAGVNVGPGERAASTLAGSVLAGVGLGRGGLLGLALAAVGGALVYRGATGHCSAYAAAGINTAR